MKKKLVILLLTIFAIMPVSISQGITLKFTGAITDSNYVCLDSVQVQNINRSWVETLVYPDTMLTFAQIGIADAQGSTADIATYPNPFNATTNVTVTLPQSGDATLQVFTLSGQKVAERTMTLEAGDNLFEVRLQASQVYLLAIVTTQGRSTVKLLNRGAGAENSILFHGNSVATEKRLSNYVFQSGDVLKITGYVTHNGAVVASHEVLQTQTVSENFTLFFTIPVVPTVTTTAASSVTATTATSGGNVTSDGGSAVAVRGVCWSTSHNPTVNGSHTIDGFGTGSFTSNITGLALGTTYYVRAYATNFVGTAYGNEDTITTWTIPTVITDIISNITDTSAVSGGNVTSDGGTSVIARGVCWSTTSNPTVNDNHTTDSTGMGSFASNITGLRYGTTYYVRAYATNSVGTAYGNEDTITTWTLPTVTTDTVGNITDTSAVSGGNVISDGGAPVIARGVCWSTISNPTINDNHTTDSTGIGSFASNITGLRYGTTYYVRAYATNSVGTAYGNEDTITTVFVYTFSVSDSTQVVFSPGNLQWSATGGGNTPTTHAVAGGGTASGTWRFALNQWDTIGAANSLISDTNSGWIDLFGWGTSGWNGKYPYMISTINADYGDGNNNISGTNYDWGVYNAIYNPKILNTDAPGTWRILTNEEWIYLLNTRSTTSGIRFALATVNGVTGLIIFPDNWSTSTYVLNSTNSIGATFAANIITSTVWTDILEAAGCAFLPAAGDRDDIAVNSVGFYGRYWSATYSGSNCAYRLGFGSGYVTPNGSYGRYLGRSVRLVKDAN